MTFSDFIAVVKINGGLREFRLTPEVSKIHNTTAFRVHVEFDRDIHYHLEQKVFEYCAWRNIKNPQWAALYFKFKLNGELEQTRTGVIGKELIV